MQGEILLALVKEVESENRRLSNPSSWRQLCGQEKMENAGCVQKRTAWPRFTNPTALENATANMIALRENPMTSQVPPELGCSLISLCFHGFFPGSSNLSPQPQNPTLTSGNDKVRRETWFENMRRPLPTAGARQRSKYTQQVAHAASVKVPTQKKKGASKQEAEEEEDEAITQSKSYTQQVSKCRRKSKKVKQF